MNILKETICIFNPILKNRKLSCDKRKLEFPFRLKKIDNESGNEKARYPKMYVVERIDGLTDPYTSRRQG